MRAAGLSEEEQERRSRPRAILLCSRAGGMKDATYFMHPFDPVPIIIEGDAPAPPKAKEDKQPHDISRPALARPPRVTYEETTLPTQLGITTGVLAGLLCSPPDDPVKGFLDVKVDNMRFAGYVEKVEKHDEVDFEPSYCGISFVLPPNSEEDVVASFQMLAKKLVVAICSLQKMNGYFAREALIMRRALEDIYEVSEAERGQYNPYAKARQQTSLAETLARLFDDVCATGIVQVFLDNFVEVSFCVESRALPYANLPPRSRTEIERLIKHIRPYHGILILKDVWPNPDPNPSVALLLKHCMPDKSLIAMSIASGIPLLQVLLIVRHLLLWARAIVVYPICNSNIYTASTAAKSLAETADRFSHEFPGCQLPSALAAFNPWSTLGSFCNPDDCIAEQQLRARIVTHLLRHQLIMQLHRYHYILMPPSDVEVPVPSIPCPDALRRMVYECLGLDEEVRELVCVLVAMQLEKESYSTVQRRLNIFLLLVPFMNGHHHLEDMMYKLNESRDRLLSVINHFSFVVCDFLRPDAISAVSM